MSSLASSSAPAGRGPRGSGTPASLGSGPSAAELSEVDLLMRLARRWRSLGLQEAAEHGLSPHQERALLALARLARRAEQDGSAEHPTGAADQPTPAARRSSGAPGRPASGVRVSHLADHLGIAPRSATEVPDALEAAGLLTRSPDPTDRRAVLLSLTEEGSSTVGRVRDRRRAAADEAVSTLSPADRAELRRLLEALLAGS